MLTSLLALLAAGQAAAAPVPATHQTLQQRFDTASDAANERRCTVAVAEFDAVQAAVARRPNPLLSAAIDVRKGRCLVRLDRAAEGVAAIRRGLPLLETKGADFAGDVRDARIMLGDVARAGFDYDAAVREYRAAIDVSAGTPRVIPLLRLSQVTMFDHDGKSLAAAEEARTLALGEPNYDRKDVAAVLTQHARVLLNEGRNQEAYKELKEGLAKQGGLGGKVGASDIATRSDLAIAALRNKDMDGARLYLAYTGAGRLRDTPFARAAAMDPPVCGSEAGLSPEDQAIVEFSLEEDGHVSGVAPIFTTGKRDVALAFARAVAEWSWRAEDAKKIPLLFRYTTRVEMRCIKSPQAPELTRPLYEATEAWLAGKGADRPAWADLPAAVALPLQRAALLRAQGAGDAAATVQAALALADNPVTQGDGYAEFMDVAVAAADRIAAPPPVRTYLAARRLSGDQWRDADDYRLKLRALLATPATASDPLAAATVRLLIARPIGKSRPPADSKALLDGVIDDTRLPARHPLKIAAMLGEANVLAAAGDLTAARAAFDRTGLTAEQCALVGLQPAVKRSGASSSDYPMEAVRLGFEGWVRTEYDIAPDGRTVTPRAVTAYPPFVFDEAATGIIKDMRYTSTFRPEGALACAGQQQSIVFSLP